MYILEDEAKDVTCHKTISPDPKTSRPCKGRKCFAFDTVDWMQTPCPHCGEAIKATETPIVWHCVAMYKYG